MEVEVKILVLLLAALVVLDTLLEKQVELLVELARVVVVVEAQ